MSAEEAKMLWEVYPHLKFQGYNIQVTVGLPGVPQENLTVILDTVSGRNPIWKERVAQYCAQEVIKMKPKRLPSAADNPLQVTKIITLLLQLAKQLEKSGFLLLIIWQWTCY